MIRMPETHEQTYAQTSFRGMDCAFDIMYLLGSQHTRPCYYIISMLLRGKTLPRVTTIMNGKITKEQTQNLGTNRALETWPLYVLKLTRLVNQKLKQGFQSPAKR